MSHELLAKTFDQWAADGRDASMEQGHGDVVGQVVARMEIASGQQILDLGCGNGWATRLLAKSGSGVSAIGIDISPEMIAKAEELHSFTIRARYEVGPFERLDFPDAKFDRVFSMEALYYAVDLDAALAEILRVLKEGGRADIVVDYFTENPGTATWAEATGVPMHYLSEAEWQQRLEAAGFQDVKVQRVHDSRGADESQFEPDCCHPTFESFRKAQQAGSLWLQCTK